MSLPILWSFRRCPYAMRARLALASSGVQTELHEVVLRDKPDEFLATSPSATVPCLNTGSEVIDESLDIMTWALEQSDPESWLKMPSEGHDLITLCDGPFKSALDHTKYPTRYQDIDVQAERDAAAAFLHLLEARLGGDEFLFGDAPKLADMAILPFVRQFAHVDLGWFDAQPWQGVIRWLEAFKDLDRFAAIMEKYPQWQPGDAAFVFP